MAAAESAFPGLGLLGEVERAGLPWLTVGTATALVLLALLALVAREIAGPSVATDAEGEPGPVA